MQCRETVGNRDWLADGGQVVGGQGECMCHGDQPLRGGGVTTGHTDPALVNSPLFSWILTRDL